MTMFPTKELVVFKAHAAAISGGEDFPVKDSADHSRSVSVIRADRLEQQNDGSWLIKKGTWSHDEAFNQPTDVYRFVSLLQCSAVYSVTCKVIQRDGYVFLDCGCEYAVERACCCGGFLSLTMLFGFLRHNLRWRFSDVLVHSHLFSFFFLAKLHHLSQKKKKNLVSQ